MKQDFFPYHPLRFRLLLGAASFAGTALTAWAAVSFARGGGPLELARTGLCAGLLLAMMTVVIKLRPRDGWGVKIGPTALVVSRPTQGQLELPWSSVREVRRVGTGRTTLALILGSDRRVLLPSHLFATRRQFEAVATAIEERLPRPQWDA